MEKCSEWCYGKSFGSVGKELACNVEDTGEAVSIPGSGRSPGERHENPLEYSCLENLMRIEAWWGTVHGVPKSQHNRLSTHVYNVVIVSAEQQRGLSHT